MLLISFVSDILIKWGSKALIVVDRLVSYHILVLITGRGKKGGAMQVFRYQSVQ